MDTTDTTGKETNVLVWQPPLVRWDGKLKLDMMAKGGENASVVFVPFLFFLFRVLLFLVS